MTPIDEAPKLAPFTLRGHNPDVLNTIANLSNDEVFTPPELANQMLDMLEKAWADGNNGANIWADHTVTFLDPFTKSGVFLREITARLVNGLEEWMPDLQQRVNHILTKQVFGIGITQLTSLLARRSVYCSKSATGKHSIVKTFDRDWGNIWFERTEHTWAGGTEKVITIDENGNHVLKATNGRCKYCGASQKEYERSDALESHAYAFIHTDDIKARMAELFGENMHFDVVIGNPPYQLSDGGAGTSAVPIYQSFAEQAKKLEPRYLSLVIPARWYSGGKGLDEFRQSMLTDSRLQEIHDFWQVGDVFPGVAIQGGVLYFLWNRDWDGDCEVTTYFEGKVLSSSRRPLLEAGTDVFIRYNEAISILKKISSVEGGTSGAVSLAKASRFSDLVSSRKPFGLDTTFKLKASPNPGDLAAYTNGGPGFKQSGRGWVSDSEVTKGRELIPSWKVFIGRAYGDRGGGGSSRDAPPRAVLGKPFIGEPGTVSTETYVAIGPLGSREEAENVCHYLSCKLVRFLVLLHKPSQDATQKVYSFVPMQDFTQHWTDDALYSKYALTQNEIDFVEWMIRPMELGDE